MTSKRQYVVAPLRAGVPIGRFGRGSGPFFDWLYFEMPFLESEAGGLWLAYDGDDVGGNLGCIAQPASLGGPLVSSCSLMSLQVSPSWRRQGVATRLLEAIRARHDVMLMVGMTPAAKAVYEKLGYENLGRMVQMFRVINPLAFGRFVSDHGRGAFLARLGDGRLAASIGARLRTMAAARAVKRPPPPMVTRERPSIDMLDALWDRVSPSHAYIAARPGRWVDWRYWRCPLFDYGDYYACGPDDALTGYAMTKRFANPSGVIVGVIVDVCVAHGDRRSLDALLEAATRDLVAAGVDIVKCAFTSTWARRSARDLGFLDPSRLLPAGRVPGRDVFIARSRRDVPMDLTRWWLTRGDSEMDFNDAPRGSRSLAPAPASAAVSM